MASERGVPEFAAPGYRPGTLPLAVVFHIGMLAVVVSCAYTVQPPLYSKLFFVVVAGLAVAVIVGLLVRRGQFAASDAGKAVTALMAGMAFSLAYDPQIAALVPSWGERMPAYVMDFAPGVGTIGLLAALLGAALYVLAGCDQRPDGVPFSRAILVSGGLLLALGIVMYSVLSPVYDLQGGMYTRLLIGRVLEYGLLLAAVLRMTGAPGVGSVPAWYLALGLLAAAARHVVGIAV